MSWCAGFSGAFYAAYFSVLPKAPGFVEGVIQVNLQIPATAASGADQLVITFGAPNTASAFSTQTGITVQVQ